MPVLMIAKAVVKDQGQFASYVEGAASLMRVHGVEVVSRARYDHTLKGSEPGAHIVAIFRYRDQQALDAFFADPDYAPLVPLRDAGCDMEFQIYTEL